MADGPNDSVVNPDEELSRFVVSSRDLRHDKTVKPDAFIPHPNQCLSVTPTRAVSEAALWQIGRRIAEVQKKALYARADVMAKVFTSQGLSFEPEPTEFDPNHLNVISWPN